MSQTIHFEQSIMELEELVRQLEKGELSLEDSLQHFEKGIRLARECQNILKKAEQKIESLTINELNPDEPLSDQ
jgi:exodeoxyribonuclease VII small subunit